MRLIGMMAVRNEDWILGLSLRAALLWVDEMIVLLHACTDRSEEIAVNIAREHSGRVIVVGKDGKWLEMQHRQAMLELARARGATHLAIIDADEVLDGNMATMCSTGRFKDIVFGTPPGSILELPGYNLRDPFFGHYQKQRTGLHQYHSNGVWGNRWFSTAFADDPILSWSGWGDTFHHREPHGKKLFPYRPIQQGQGGVMHLWGASERRLIAKHRAYRIAERLKFTSKPAAEIERMYSWATDGEPGNAAYGTPATWTYSLVPASWWAPYAHLMKYLDLDAEPWQERWCDEQIALHGEERFAGLRV